MAIVNDKVLESLNESSTHGGGGTEKLNDKRIAGKLAKLYEANDRPAGDTDSVARMKARNAALRLAKNVAPRGEERRK